MLAKVFILEKDYSTAYSLAESFKNPGGYEIQIATNPDFALKAIAQWQPHIVLAECAEIDGGWLCRELKKLDTTKKITVILMCHKGKDKTEQEVKDILVSSYACDDAITKPFTVERVMKLIHKHFVILFS